MAPGEKKVGCKTAQRKIITLQNVKKNFLKSCFLKYTKAISLFLVCESSPVEHLHIQRSSWVLKFPSITTVETTAKRVIKTLNFRLQDCEAADQVGHGSLLLLVSFLALLDYVAHTRPNEAG